VLQIILKSDKISVSEYTLIKKYRGGVLMKKDLQDKIAKIAYDLYEKKGRREGCHFEDWIEAERIVIYEQAGEPEKRVKAKTVKPKVASATEKKAVAKVAAPKAKKTTTTKKKTTKE
jgi:hypothetical protein